MTRTLIVRHWFANPLWWDWHRWLYWNHEIRGVQH
jgi:hypothetical protein